MRYFIYFYLFAIVFSQYITAQKKISRTPDSLKNKSFDYLDYKIYELRKDSSKAAIYLTTYLKKAKKEQNWKEIINGYQNYLHQAPPPQDLIYADSMIYAGKKSGDTALIGSAYLSKGIIYYGQKKQTEALDYYLIANSYISKTNEGYLHFKLKYHIALIKFYLGYYDEAVSLTKDCVGYFKDKRPIPYLNSLHFLGLGYNKTGEYDLCSKTNALGIIECSRLNVPSMKPYFIHSEGINNYFKHDYLKAIQHIQTSIPKLQKDDFDNVAIGNFYIGKSYWALDQKDNAFSYFFKVDSIFNKRHYLRPDLREVYEILYKYYKNEKDTEKQLYYANQLLKADTVLYNTNKYLIKKVHKEYDTSAIIHEKEQINKELNKEKQYDTIFISIILLLIIISVYLIIRHYKNRTIYEKRFNLLMEEIDATYETDSDNLKSPIPGISSETVATILQQLEKFEEDEKFLEEDWNQGSLATYFKTNPKNLGRIIKHYRGKGFYDYINDIRIDYVISLLHKDPKYRKYTYSALAEEAGFSTTQRFSLAFKAKAGMPVNFFIEQINK